MDEIRAPLKTPAWEATFFVVKVIFVPLISLPSLLDHDVKMLNSRFVEDVNTRKRLSKSFFFF